MSDEHMSITQAEKETIVKLIRALLPDVKIYLFGSHARGTNVRGSDVDLALDAGKKLTHVQVGEIKEVVNATNIPYIFDVVDFHSVRKEMQEMINQEGIEWTFSDPQCFYAYTRRAHSK